MRRRVALRAMCVLVALLALEAGVRATLRWRIGVPFWRPDRALVAFYPQLRYVAGREILRGDDAVNVLLLGGSVLDPEWSAVAVGLGERLEAIADRPARVHILARRGQTSRDSRLQYGFLEHAHFDVVLVYHGINDVALNRTHRGTFHADYSHEPGFALRNAAASSSAVTALPFASAWLSSFRLPAGQSTVQRYPLRTPPAFRANLEEIVRLAAGRDQQVVVGTFATYRPPGYSLEAFQARQLDYGRHRVPIEAWGDPDDVIAGVEAHNREIRALAAAHPGTVYLADVAAGIPPGAKYFDDVCHLTVAGSLRMVDLLEPALRAALVPPADPPR